MKKGLKSSSLETDTTSRNNYSALSQEHLLERINNATPSNSNYYAAGSTVADSGYSRNPPVPMTNFKNRRATSSIYELYRDDTDCEGFRQAPGNVYSSYREADNETVLVRNASTSRAQPRSSGAISLDNTIDGLSVLTPLAEVRPNDQTTSSVLTRNEIEINEDNSREYINCRHEVSGRAIWRYLKQTSSIINENEQELLKFCIAELSKIKRPWVKSNMELRVYSDLLTGANPVFYSGRRRKKFVAIWHKNKDPEFIELNHSVLAYFPHWLCRPIQKERIRLLQPRPVSVK